MNNRVTIRRSYRIAYLPKLSNKYVGKQLNYVYIYDRRNERREHTHKKTLTGHYNVTLVVIVAYIYPCKGKTDTVYVLYMVSMPPGADIL